MSRVEIGGARALVIVAVAVVVALAPGATRAQAQKPRSKQEEQRRQLLEKMGLEKNDAPAPAPVVPDAEAPEERRETPGPARTGAPVTPASPSFRRAVHPLLIQMCKGCHAPGAPAAATAMILTGDAAVDHTSVRKVLDVRAPAASAILVKASGQKLHAGGAPWPVGGPAYGRVLAWIQGGARLDGVGRAAPPPVVVAPVAPAPAPSRAARKPEPEPGAASAPSVPPLPTVADAAATDAPVAEAVRAPAPDDFAAVVHPLLVRSCAACHGPVGVAAGTRLVLSGDVAADYAKARPLVDPAAPAASPLLAKATGEMHAGGPVLKAGSPEHALLLGWVSAGALEHPAAAPTTGPAAAAPPPAALPPPAPVAAAAPASAPPSPHHPGAGGIGMPAGLMLNGRFDLNYERHDFTGNPLADGTTDALRSYHHFLFLSRESADDPVGLSLEVLTLQFWEVHFRWRPDHLPIRVLVQGGKIFVPFGADPLMHQSYGGLAGFDQKILPPVWAQEGGAVHVTFTRRALAITDDVYVVHGYALRRPDDVLNLQSDFSPADDVRLGVGNRIGAAFGPVSGWYSTYFNTLGFGRRLFMQAFDVMLWRLRGVPVLGHFSAAAGLLRADVSGGDDQGVGGPGLDYYDFGSYFQLRYHPTDWLIVQYRQGLRTFNNRRGVIVDDTRLTSEDASAHNFGVIARWRGITGGLFYFINLEKGPELRNDFIRLSVTYDF